MKYKGDKDYEEDLSASALIGFFIIVMAIITGLFLLARWFNS
jgi:hypothetical protein